MSGTREISCACWQTCLELKRSPIVVTECLCDSCRAAAARLATLLGAWIGMGFKNPKIAVTGTIDA